MSSQDLPSNQVALVGWWAGYLAIWLAWLCNLTILLLPVGLAILNNIPKVLALQESTRGTKIVVGTTTMTVGTPKQYNFWLRALFFVFVGWWWSGLWLHLAYVLCLSIILMPVGLELFKLAPFMTTLRRY